MAGQVNSVFAFVTGLGGWRRHSCAFLAGALAAAALAPVYVVPVLLISVPCLVLLIDGCRRPLQAFAVGWWFGLGYFVAGLYWLANAFLVDAETYAWLIPLAVFVLPSILAIFTGAAMVAARMAWSAGPERILTLALAWSAGEWLRGHLFTGFPWNLFGYVWTFSDAMIQSTAVVGIYGLSLLTVAIAASPATLVGRDLARVASWRFVLGAAALCLLLFSAGAIRIAATEIETVAGVELRLVQANIPQDQKWLLDKRRDNFVLHLTMSEASRSDRISHVIWPETAVPYFIAGEPSRRSLIGRVSPPGGMVLTGAVRLRREGNTVAELWNSFHAIGPKGDIIGTYDKSHLVPFGEYLPMRGLLEWFGISKLVPGGSDFSAGQGVRTLRLPGLPPVSVLICYEAIFPGAVADRDDRPAWLLNITNDAWYGHSAGPYQHLAMTRVRAVEEGIPLVRAASTGISAVVDPLGRIVKSIGLGKRGVVDSELPVALTQAPPYARLGDLMFLALVLAMGIAGWASVKRRKA